MLGKKRHGKPTSLAELCAMAANLLYISAGGGCTDQVSRSSGFRGLPAFSDGISGWVKSGSGSFLGRARASAAAELLDALDSPCASKCGKGSAADWYIDMKKKTTKCDADFSLACTTFGPHVPFTYLRTVVVPVPRIAQNSPKQTCTVPIIQLTCLKLHFPVFSLRPEASEYMLYMTIARSSSDIDQYVSAAACAKVGLTLVHMPSLPHPGHVCFCNNSRIRPTLVARVARFWAFRLLPVSCFNAPRTITASTFMARVAFWTFWPAGSSASLDALQAPELLDASSFGHGPDSVDSADFLDFLALAAPRSSGHAPLLLVSSLAPDHAPLLSGDVRLRPEPGWDPFFLPALRAIRAGKNCKEACVATEQAEIAKQSNHSDPWQVGALFWILSLLHLGLLNSSPRRAGLRPPRFSPHALTPCARTAVGLSPPLALALGWVLQPALAGLWLLGRIHPSRRTAVRIGVRPLLTLALG